jgi:putative peptidoglycan lipid II flippase
MSVAASELPELSRLTKEKAASFSARLRRSLRHIAFLTVPTVVGYLAFGVLLVGALFRTGQFQAASTWLVAIVLGGYSLGILATTMSRLLQNAFYAIGDTKTPAWIAVLRVTVSTVVAVPTMFWLDTVAIEQVVGPLPGGDLFFGALGLSLGATVGAWGEVAALRWRLRRPLPGARIPWRRAAAMAGLAIVSLVPVAGVWWLLPDWHVLIAAPVVVGAYAAVYLGAAWGLGFDEIEAWTQRFLG